MNYTAEHRRGPVACSSVLPNTFNHRRCYGTILLQQRFFLFFCSLFFSVQHLHAQKLPALGMVSSLENDSLLYVSGFRVIGTSVGSLISPSLSEEAFRQNVKKIASLQCELYMCNVLFPPALKIAGPDVEEKKVLDYLDAVLLRAQKAGIKHLVLGSGGARGLPKGYDAVKAKADFTLLAKKMAIAASKHKVTIILENLNSTETNFLNTLRDAADVVRTVNHPSFRLNADIYHMMKENESPEEIRKAGDVIIYSEIAEKETRTLPGMTGDDFRPYLQALKAIGFMGPIMIEGRVNSLHTDVPKAYTALMAQLQEVYVN
ncbi:MAG TPA: sugar phosphate isomerase/epimerase family protein [Flavisolibacter sp.]|jgi:sugar phosphate isomerase/epimerase|nr:sugar phosphate isomerase/epimerase family protein [Flavisolibacter sp.]